MPHKEIMARTLFRSADCVCFDVDSTVCVDEAIDELAGFAGKTKQVADITRRAMRGGYTFRAALKERLDMIQPSVGLLQEYIDNHPPRLTAGVRELIRKLHERRTDVYLVSGGFDALIEPVAQELNIPYKNIFANKIRFFFNGSYAGFDEQQPTSQQDGKAQVISYLKQMNEYRRVIMVGDGATDLEACPPADAFIGFGGNCVRDRIRQESHWFVHHFDDMLHELNRS